MSPMHSDQEISENAIDDDDFSKELPFEAEYYRTSTDRDDFVRPIASPQNNEIDDGKGGIDLNDPSTYNQTPDCVYHIDIKLQSESIDQLNIQLNGLTLKNGVKNNLTLNEFTAQAQSQLFSNIQGENLTNELVNDIISYLRSTFVSVYGYKDLCGVSTSVTNYFIKNDTQVDSPTVLEAITNSPFATEKQQPELFDSNTEQPQVEISEIEILNIETTPSSETSSSEDDTTDEYESKVLTRPKLSAVVQQSIDFYKALRNWHFSQKS